MPLTLGEFGSCYIGYTHEKPPAADTFLPKGPSNKLSQPWLACIPTAIRSNDLIHVLDFVNQKIKTLHAEVYVAWHRQT